MSGNPSGKQKDAKRLAEEFGTQINPKTGRSMDEHFIQLLYRRACQGNMRAAELWANYRWGKPVQYTVTAELSPEQKVAGMSEEEMDARLAELLERVPPKSKRIQ